MTALKRIIEYNKDAGIIRYEGDPRHAEMIVKMLGLESAKIVSTPSEKQTLDEVLADMALPTVANDRISLVPVRGHASSLSGAGSRGHC